MKLLAVSLLRVFAELGKEKLDLHTLLESVGSDPRRRRLALDAIEELKRDGMLDERSGDYYALTEKGKNAIALA